MPQITSARDLFLHELGDILYVERKLAYETLPKLIEEVNDDQVAVEIVSRQGTAYLVSADEYHALRETVHLLQSPRNAARLSESLEDVQAGRLLEKDVPVE